MKEQLIIEYKNGKTTYELAEKYNVWPDQIRKYLITNKVKIRPRGTRKVGWISPMKGRPSIKKKDNNNIIESGEYKNLKECHQRARVKRYLIENTGHKCCICNFTKWNDLPIPLTCDHIDGNSSNSEITNFRLICPNCDRQQPTFGSKNRGQGRKTERLRYYKNKF